jgi:RHS repeat-associated protein
MNRHAISFLSLLGLFVLGCTSSVVAQDPDDIQQGIKAYGTYRGGDMDSVSMTNGNLIVDIPLVSYPQRGKLHLDYKLIYNNRHYYQHTTCFIDTCTTHVVQPIVSPIAAVYGQSFSTNQVVIQVNKTEQFSSDSLVASDGASHQLSTNGETVDATGFNSGARGVADANGTSYPANYAQEDVNGNQITVPNGSLDTVGRSIPLGSGQYTGNGNGPGNCPGGPLPVYANVPWVVPGPTGGTSTFLFCWAQVYVWYSYSVDDGTYLYKNMNYLQSVVLPNGTAWTFQYSSPSGSLTQITFPAGGTISYVWIGQQSCTPISYPIPWVSSRTVNANDGTGNHTWNYSYSYPLTMTVADPLGNNTVYTNTYESYCSAYTTNVQSYQGAVQPANLLKTVSTTYSRSVSPFSVVLGSNYMNIVPTQITTTWANGKTSQATEGYDSGFTFPSPRPGDNTVYTGIYGKVTVQKEYDYGTTPGVPGPLLRQTNTSYAWQSPNPNYSTYVSNNMLNLVYSTQITDGTNQKAYTQYGYDETATITSGMGASQNLDLSVWTGTLRGNQTSVNHWLNLPTVQTVTSKTTYYDTGMPSVAKDPLLNPTTYFYSSTFQDAYVTQVENALSQSTYHNYDYDTGSLTSTTDPNGQVTTDGFDIDWRLTSVTRPTGGGQTSFCYTDLGGSTCSQGSAPYQVVITKEITSAKNETATAIVDGLGRLAHTQLNSDPEGIDYVDDTYDGVGNKATSSNPYRTTSDSTYGITTNTYDGLHRVTQVTQADGSLLKTAYCANTTLVTDEAGHWRRSTVDGLGRLIEVDEPNSTTATVNSNGCPGTGEPIWVTTYGYDTLGNLTSVLQAGSRARGFSYDSLSRLLAANNPESGNLAYTYDANGNVTTKVSPLQNQTNSSLSTTITYCYETPPHSLNRLTAKGYGSSQQTCTNGTIPTPVATYSYDGSGCLGQASCYNIGHRTGMTDLAGSESWAYDTMGRTVVQSRTTNSITKTTTYTYDLDSSVATLKYPSGRVVTYTPDRAGRPSSVMDNTTSVYYSTGACANGVSGNGVCYAPQGAVAQLQYGSSLVSTHIYNDRLQPCWMYSTTGTALAWSTTLCTGTATAGNMLDLKYNFNLGSDNGNPISITNNRVSDRSQTFSYDQLNRISTAKTTATHSSNPTDCWGQAFGYDTTGNWSNLLSIAGVSSAYTGCTQGSLTAAVNANNQITGDTYDAAGNLMTVPGTGGATYVFNAENQMTSTSNSTMQYVYDGDGNRVEKSGSKIYWFGGAEILDETDTTGSVANSSFNEYVFFGAARVARRDSSGNVFYYLADQLDTSRVIAEVPSGQTTATLCYDADFEPFGGEHAYTNTCPQNYKFTGKERDSESSLDNFGARYYASTTGRFTTPDWALKPVTVPYAKFGDPQSLNLYTYVENSPLNRIDADGHCPPCDDNGQPGFAHIGGMANPDNNDFLDMVKRDGNGLIHEEPGKVVLMGGTIDVSTTANAGFVQVNSTGARSIQAVPGVGGTVDITLHAPGATPNALSLSAGTPVVSGSLTTNSATLSVGFVAGPPVKAGLNISADATAVKETLSSLVSSAASAVRGAFTGVSPPPPPPPPPNTSWVLTQGSMDDPNVMDKQQMGGGRVHMGGEPSGIP